MSPLNVTYGARAMSATMNPIEILSPYEGMQVIVLRRQEQTLRNRVVVVESVILRTLVDGVWYDGDELHGWSLFEVHGTYRMPLASSLDYGDFDGARAAGEYAFRNWCGDYLAD
jgi:hypothetical protein